MTAEFIALATIVRREIGRFLRIWTQTIIPPILTSILFILIFGFSLGSRISEIHGVSYLQFIIPGLLMMGVIMSAYSTAFSLYLQRFQGSIQELLVAPISYWHMILGITLGGVLRALLVGAGILIVSLIFGAVTIQHFFVVLLFIILVSMLFAFAGIVTALWANDFDQLNIFSTFLITPLTYLGGVFYSVDMLPAFWRSLAHFNPILYMVDGFRFGFLGHSDIPLLYSLGIVVALTIFFFVLCVQMFRRGYKLRT